MDEYQEGLLGASRLRRLEMIMDFVAEHKRSLHEWDPRDRKWLAELLYPFSSPKFRDCRLLPSPEMSSDEGGIVLDALYALMRRGSQQLPEFVENLSGLRTKLTQPDAALDTNDADRVLEFAHLLRNHLLDGLTVPSQPEPFAKIRNVY